MAPGESRRRRHGARQLARDVAPLGPPRGRAGARRPRLRAHPGALPVEPGAGRPRSRPAGARRGPRAAPGRPSRGAPRREVRREQRVRAGADPGVLGRGRDGHPPPGGRRRPAVPIARGPTWCRRTSRRCSRPCRRSSCSGRVDWCPTSGSTWRSAPRPLSTSRRSSPGPARTGPGSSRSRPRSGCRCGSSARSRRPCCGPCSSARVLYVFLPVEDFGIMAAEAIALGVPTLVNADGGAREIVAATGGGATVSGPPSRADLDTALRATWGPPGGACSSSTAPCSVGGSPRGSARCPGVPDREGPRR